MQHFYMLLQNIQPSQLYINVDKLTAVEQMLEINRLQPLPIKRLGQRVFFTDGHTRALALYLKGMKEIPVYWDEEELDWTAYLVCLNWCDEAGIKTIADLRSRVIGSGEYTALWDQRCDELHQTLTQNHDHYAQIRPITEPQEKSAICETILRQLPDWFGIEEAIVYYTAAVQTQDFLAVTIGDIPVGFISILDHYEFSSEICVMGILQEFHHMGFGKQLVATAEVRLLQKNKKYLIVKTLSEAHPDPGYARTRQFYLSVGFTPLEELKTLWDEANPCLYMLKPLQQKEG